MTPRWRRTLVIPGAVAAVAVVSAFLPLTTASAATRPDLGTASSFAVVAGGKVTNQGPTSVAGNVGVGPGQYANGLPRERVNGTVHLGDAAWTGAHGDLSRAFDPLAAPSCDAHLPDDDFGGKVVSPGTTCVASAARLSRTLTLDGRGDPDAVFVLRAPGPLTTEAGSAVVLVNGAQACNVVFRVGDSATLGADSSFRGNILAERSITLGSAAALDGRALSRGGDVNLVSNTVSVPMCAARAALPPAATGPAPLGPLPASSPTTSGQPERTGPPATEQSPTPGSVPSVVPGPDAPSTGEAAVDLEGSGDDTEKPPGDSSSFPPDLAARRDSVQRTGPSNSQALIDALAPLTGYGLTPEQIAQIGFGRFPVAGAASYTHDWWFPRFGPGWRLHEGTDIFAAAGTPVRSPTEGKVRLLTGGLGGITVYVVEPNGTYYYLAHLAGRAPGLVEGASVTTGQVVGFVGTSGNALGTPPHVHFEVHPNGGGPVDPKPVLDGFLADALAGTTNLISAYSAAPSAVVDGAAASAQLPLPADSGPGGPTPGVGTASAPSSGVSTSTLFWALLAGLAGLMVSRARGGEVVVVARPPRAGSVQERVRPTMRSLYRRWVAPPASAAERVGTLKTEPGPFPPGDATRPSAVPPPRPDLPPGNVSSERVQRRRPGTSVPATT